MTTNNPISISLSSARGWKKAERVTKDVAPTKIRSAKAVGTTRQNDECSGSGSDSDSDSDPSLPRSHQSTNSRKNRSESLVGHCSVCGENEARYTCPRCSIPYCSAECYRSHTSGETGTAHSCTERFFREKVASLMKLESLEHRGETHRALNRYHHDCHYQTNPLEEEPVHKSPGGRQHAGDEDLYDLHRLHSELEALENDGEELSRRELARILPPALRAVFENDLRSGRVRADMVLDRWHPWWRRDFVDGSNETGADQSDGRRGAGIDDREDGAVACSRTLDERLLRVPGFAGFGRKDNHKSNNDVLFFNLLDILCATCRTLRMYHGVENASQQAPVEAATTLIAASSVLANDTRFAALSQVLDHHYYCTMGPGHGTIAKMDPKEEIIEPGESTSNKQPNTAGWYVCMEDTASLVTSPRLVGRAILEACDVLKAAAKELKTNRVSTKVPNNSTSTNATPSASKEANERYDNETKLYQIRRLRKKLQFYLSWALHRPSAANSYLGVHAKEEIVAWINERKQMITEYECGEWNTNDNNIEHCGGVGDSTITTLNFPASAASGTTRSMFQLNSLHNGDKEHSSPTESITDQPFMIEVQSRRRQ